MYTVHEAIKIDSDRISQVQVATIAALATMTVDYMQSTQKVQPLPIRTSVISLDDGNEALLLIRQKDASSDVYATHRANLLSYTNDLLRIFNQPPLPSYTSQSRTEIDGHY
ncbi:hypothetical protein KJ845_00185 [Patescibacteria group bacterium]|nr:hypothetical protein [Patescibacteria group bacterium]